MNKGLKKKTIFFLLATQALLSASNLLEVAAVRDACCRFLERHIDATNCVGIHCFAEAHACHDLTKKAKAYTLRLDQLCFPCYV